MLPGIVTWAEIDLDAIAENVRKFKRHVGGAVEVIAVVKANAYGHGSVPVSRAALAAGATRLAVHRLPEGVLLRRAGIQAPVLLMGYTPPEGAGAVVDWRLTPTVTTLELAQALSARASAAGVVTPVHVKIDTGMSRYGLMPEEALQFLQAIGQLPGIYLEGLFTHFATADWNDQRFTLEQLDLFTRLLAELGQSGIRPPVIHAANSAAAMRLPAAHFNAVRPGVALYGMQPSSEWPPIFDLKPALTLKSPVCRVHWLAPGSAVSYGRTYIAQQPTQVGLVPVGYGDGYHRILSNRGVVLIHGQRAPLIGRVCMDQFVVDVTGIQDVQQDDEVVLIGQQGQAAIRAEELAALAGTINYEITTTLLPRVARVYYQGGQIVETTP